MELLQHLFATGLSTITDVLPIAGIIFGFQLLVLRQKVPHLKQVLVGFVYVLVGLHCSWSDWRLRCSRLEN